jgi:DNA-nicking Smr family endonuclease
MSEDEDWAAFKEAVKGVNPISANDKVSLTPKDKLSAAKNNRRNALSKISAHEKRSNAYFEFSDQFEAVFSDQGPLKYARDKKTSSDLKRLRRGEFSPELVLDMHGMTREVAKSELAALLYEAKRLHLECVCVVHGIGSGVLRQQLPNWLVQHPDVLAFHQATLEWGGNGALLVLINASDPKLG